MKGLSDALAAQFDPLFAMGQAMQDNAAAQANLRDAQEALAAAVRDHGASSDEAAEAQRNLESAQLDSAQSAVGLTDAAVQLQASIDESGQSATAARENFIQMALGAGYTRGQAEELAAQLFGTTAEADRLASRAIDLPIEQHGGQQTIGLLDRGTQSALRLGAQRPNVHTSTSGTLDAVNRLLGVRDAVNAIPSNKTINVHAAIDDLAFGWVTAGKRATGGPVGAGRLYEVGEQGRAEDRKSVV